MLRSDRLPPATTIVLIAALATLSMAGTRASDIRPEFFVRSAPGGAILAGLFVLAGAVWLLQAGPVATNDARVSATSSPDPKGMIRAINHGHFWLALGSVAIILGCFLLRHAPTHSAGRALWLGSVLALLVCVYCRRGQWALLFGIVSYTWVARDYEWLILVPALVVAEVVGNRSSGHSQLRTVAPIPWLALHVTFLFSLTSLLRIGLQGGLQLETLDLAVGTYGDGSLPVWLGGACLGYKFLVAQLLLLGIYLRGFSRRVQAGLLLGLGLAQLARGVCLLLMLFVSGQSYWTAFRVIADLPFALVGFMGVALAGALGWLYYRGREVSSWPTEGERAY